MDKMWKLFWDIFATISGVFVGYKAFIFCGEHIPAFGYIPIGIIAFLLLAPIGFYSVYFVELAILKILSVIKIQE